MASGSLLVRTPCQDFDQVVQIGVVDVLAEGRIGEDVVDDVCRSSGCGRGLGGDGSAPGDYVQPGKGADDAV